jgi:hypothetical protein
MGFFSALFGGQNNTLSGDIGSTGSIGGFATQLGEQNLGSASKFWNNILSGNSSDISKALAPEISSAKTSAQQQNATTAQFGTRSGGTAASAASTNDKVHSDITNLIGSLTGSAASGLASTGSGLLSTGLSAYGQQAELSQQQMQNWENSILGKSITGGVAAAESFGLGAAGGALAGTGAGAGGMQSLLFSQLGGR